MQVELPANTKIEYKYVILEEQVRVSALSSLCDAYDDSLIYATVQKSA